MRNGRRVEPPSELVYVPGPSWAPVLAGAGIAVVAIGLFAGIVYAIVGGSSPWPPCGDGSAAGQRDRAAASPAAREHGRVARGAAAPRRLGPLALRG